MHSAVQARIPLKILNWGGEHTGLGNKLLASREELSRLHPCTVALFVDSYDVLFLAGEDQFRARVLELMDNGRFPDGKV